MGEARSARVASNAESFGRAYASLVDRSRALSLPEGRAAKLSYFESWGLITPSPTRSKYSIPPPKASRFPPSASPVAEPRDLQVGEIQQLEPRALIP